MGAIYEARCICGYESAELTAGCGFQQICWDLATCRRCRAVVSVRTGKVPRCPRCRGAVTVLDLGADREVLSDAPDPVYPCPACRRHTLRLVPAALWD
jgi:hypothetical protein